MQLFMTTSCLCNVLMSKTGEERLDFCPPSLSLSLSLCVYFTLSQWTSWADHAFHPCPSSHTWRERERERVRWSWFLCN